MDDTFKMPRNTGAYPSWEPPKDNQPMQSTAITQVQAPELALSAEIEPFAKGGWKTTIRASVRTFDGDAAAMYIQLEAMVQSGLAIAHNAITAHEDQIKPAPPFMEEPNGNV